MPPPAASPPSRTCCAGCADPMLEILEALSVIAAAFALYYRFRYARGVKRLQKMLEEQKRTKDD